MRRFVSRSLALAFALAPFAAGAAPIVSVDADPDLPGVQDVRAVSLGAAFEIAVWIEAVDPGDPLHAFELALTHGPHLSVTAVSLGDFLGLDALLFHAETSPDGAEAAATRLGPEGRAGAGSLLRVGLVATALGSSALDLSGLRLAAPFGVPIEIEALRGAVIRAVPEAATGSLLLAGLLALAARRQPQLDTRGQTPGVKLRG